MLDYLLLSNKKTIKLPDREAEGSRQTCYDLLTKVAIENSVPPYDVIVVNEYYIARPDLISLAVYGEDRYGDLICKYNGLSNPFELNKNMILFIPTLDRIDYMYTADQPASELIDEDDSRSKLLMKQNKFKKEKDEVRTPANVVVGENNYVIDKSLGVVFY